jgi:DNA repair photolyase
MIDDGSKSVAVFEKPIYPDLGDRDVERIIGKIHAFYC